jgi:hypothetical protein
MREGTHFYRKLLLARYEKYRAIDCRSGVASSMVVPVGIVLGSGGVVKFGKVYGKQGVGIGLAFKVSGVRGGQSGDWRSQGCGALSKLGGWWGEVSMGCRRMATGCRRFAAGGEVGFARRGVFWGARVPCVGTQGEGDVRGWGGRGRMKRFQISDFGFLISKFGRDGANQERCGSGDAA